MASEQTAKLNLTITAQDQAKSVVEAFAQNMKATFEELQNTLKETFNGGITTAAKEMADSVTSSLNGINANEATDALKKFTDSTFITRQQAEEQFNAMRGFIGSDTLAGVDVANLSIGDLRKVLRELGDDNSVQIYRDKFQESMDKVQSTAFMTRDQLTTSFNALKRAMPEFAQGIESAAQLSDSQLKNLVAKFQDSDIQIIKSMDDVDKTLPNRFETAMENLQQTAFMTRDELESAFNGIKSSLPGLSGSFETASQLSTEQLKKIVSAAQQTDIQVIKSMDEMSQKTKLSFSEVSHAAMDMQMGGDIVKGVGEKIGGFLAESAKSFVDFNQEVVNTQMSLQVLGEKNATTKGTYDELSNAALKMGKTGFYSANDLAKAMNVLAKQGVGSQAILNGALQATHDTAIANQQDLDETANVVSDIYHEMGDQINSSVRSSAEGIKIMNSNMTNSQKESAIMKLSFQQIGDVMTGSMHQSRIKMTDFLNTMKYAGPQASALGVNIKDLGATIALLGEHGIRANQAGTTLRRMMTNLTPASAAAEEQMKQLGMITYDSSKALQAMNNMGLHPASGSLADVTKSMGEYITKTKGLKEGTAGYNTALQKALQDQGFYSNAFYDSTGKMKSMTEVQQILHDKLAGLSPQMQQMAIKTIFGQYALSGMTAIVGTAPSKFQELSNKVGKAGLAHDAMAEKAKGLGFQAQALQKHFDTIQKEIGERLAPAIEGLMKTANTLMKRWDGLSDSQKNLIIHIAEFAAIILTVVGAVAAFGGTMMMLINGIKGAVTVFKGIGTAIKGLSVAFDFLAANPIIAILLGIAAVAFILYEAWTHNFGGIQQKTKAVVHAIGGFFTNMGRDLKKIWNTVKTDAEQIWNGITNFFKKWGLLLLTAIAPAIGLPILIATHWKQIQKFASDIWNAVVNGIKKLWNEFSSWVVGVAKAFTKGIVDSFNWLYNHNYYFKDLVDFIKNAWDTIKKDAEAVWNAITSSLKKAWDAITSVLKQTWDGFKKLISEAWDSISSVARAFWNREVSGWTNIWNGIVSVAKTIWNALSKFFSDLWNTISSGVSNAWNKVSSTMGNLAHKAVDGVKSVFKGLGSFFSGLGQDAFNWGKNVVSMIADGIKNAAGQVANAAQDVANNIKNFLGFHSPTKMGPGSEGDVWMPNMMKMFKQGIDAHKGTVLKSVSDVALGIKHTIQGDTNGAVPMKGLSVAPAPSTTNRSHAVTVNINIDGRSMQTDKQLAEQIAHTFRTQMSVVSAR